MADWRETAWRITRKMWAWWTGLFWSVTARLSAAIYRVARRNTDRLGVSLPLRSRLSAPAANPPESGEAWENLGAYLQEGLQKNLLTQQAQLRAELDAWHSILQTEIRTTRPTPPPAATEDKVPEKLLLPIARQYNAIYKKLDGLEKSLVLLKSALAAPSPGQAEPSSAPESEAVDLPPIPVNAEIHPSLQILAEADLQELQDLLAPTPLSERAWLSLWYSGYSLCEALAALLAMPALQARPHEWYIQLAAWVENLPAGNDLQLVLPVMGAGWDKTEHEVVEERISKGFADEVLEVKRPGLRCDDAVYCKAQVVVSS